MDNNDISLLLDELTYAIKATDNNDLILVGQNTVKTTIDVSRRRGSNLASVATNVISVTSNELKEAGKATVRGELLDYSKDRSNKLKEGTSAAYNESKKLCKSLEDSFSNDPKVAAIKLAGIGLGFQLGSGGFDGDGGVPDLDLLGGIGEHRSLLTHSIFAGIVIEVLAMTFLDLIKVVSINLPENRSNYWDDLLDNIDNATNSTVTGLSAGIAYHLGIDATLDSDGTYKNLPFYMPQEGHIGLTAVNAVTEGADAIRRPKNTESLKSSNCYSTFLEAKQEAKKSAGSTIHRNGEEGFVVRYRTNDRRIR